MLRKSPASWQHVTVSPAVPRMVPSMPCGYLLPCASWPPALAGPSPSCSFAVIPGAGGWGPWGPWSSCSRSCGGGLRSRMRACDQPPPQGLGDYCEGPRAQGEACQALPCPGTCQERGTGVREHYGETGWGGRHPHGSQPTLSPSPVTNCTTIQGAEYSPCGPPCPRSCDDLVVSLAPSECLPDLWPQASLCRRAGCGFGS